MSQVVGKELAHAAYRRCCCAGIDEVNGALSRGFFELKVTKEKCAVSLPFSAVTGVTHRKISRPKSSTCAAAIHTRANQAITATLRTIEREVLIFPAHTACKAALTELQLDVFDVKRI